MNLVVFASNVACERYWWFPVFFCICFELLTENVIAAVPKRRSLGDIFDDNLIDINGVGESVRVELPPKPVFLKGHGVEGVNYDLDNHSRPYIKCDFYDISSCDPTKSDCPSSKMCYASANDHRLGCMAALVSNPSTRQVTLKGCWMHDGNLGNCDSEKCLADERATGQGSAALFCCCNTHNCNRHVHFPPQVVSSTASTTTTAAVEIEDRGIIPAGLWAAFAIVVGVVAVSACIVAGCWGYREFHSSQHYKAKAAEVFSKPTVNEAKSPLINSARDKNLQQVTNLTLVTRGRFGEIFRGLRDGITVAVKVFPPVDTNSWVTEQDIYSIPSLRTHENILRYIAYEVSGADHWLITEFHENGSLYDFLQFRVLKLHEALKIIASMLRGLAFLHEEKIIDGQSKPCIVHRDFKSKNVLLKTDLTAVIGDFGLAMKCENGQMPADDNHGQVGTRRYMSPEVLEGATEFTAFAFRQIDVYAAALVLWEVLWRTAMNEDDVVEEYQRPYETEAGIQPTLHDLRRVVAVQKIRPQIRSAVMRHNIGGVLWKTTEDMWDMEADGRITSGCAYERANTLYLSYARKTSPGNGVENQLNVLPGPPPPYPHEDRSVPSVKDLTNNFHPSINEYAQACSAPPNVRCTSLNFDHPLNSYHDVGGPPTCKSMSVPPTHQTLKLKS